MGEKRREHLNVYKMNSCLIIAQHCRTKHWFKNHSLLTTVKMIVMHHEFAFIRLHINKIKNKE